MFERTRWFRLALPAEKLAEDWAARTAHPPTQTGSVR